MNPPPRDTQVNVRLTQDEHDRMIAAAERDGYRSLSDFVRSVVLSWVEKPEADDD